MKELLVRNTSELIPMHRAYARQGDIEIPCLDKIYILSVMSQTNTAAEKAVRLPTFNVTSNCFKCGRCALQHILPCVKK
jgi:hypothetical protein